MSVLATRRNASESELAGYSTSMKFVTVMLENKETTFDILEGNRYQHRYRVACDAGTGYKHIALTFCCDRFDVSDKYAWYCLHFRSGAHSAHTEQER